MPRFSSQIDQSDYSFKRGLIEDRETMNIMFRGFSSVDGTLAVKNKHPVPNIVIQGLKQCHQAHLSSPLLPVVSRRLLAVHWVTFALRHIRRGEEELIPKNAGKSLGA